MNIPLVQLPALLCYLARLTSKCLPQSDYWNVCFIVLGLRQLNYNFNSLRIVDYSFCGLR
jgi:hypothetical protein